MRDSPARPGPVPPWMRPLTNRMSPTIRALVIVTSVVFAFYAVVREAQVFFQEHLALGPAAARGELWQPVTSLFVHLDFVSFAFNLIGLWWLGAAVEHDLGTRRFLRTFFATGIAANAAIVLVMELGATPGIFAGCGSAVLALFVVFGTIHGRAQARILGGLILQARTLAAILVAFALLSDLMRGAWPALAGDVVAVLLGYFMAGGRGDGLVLAVADWRSRHLRRRYQVFEGGRRDRSGRRRTPYVN